MLTLRRSKPNFVLYEFGNIENEITSLNGLIPNIVCEFDGVETSS